MKRTRRKQDRDRRKANHRAMMTKIDELHRKAPFIKRVFRRRGINLPFYDFYDSYFKEFQKVSLLAQTQFPSLLGVIEADDVEYFNDGHSRLGSELTQIHWETEADLVGYGTLRDESNINGNVMAYVNDIQEVRTLIVIRKSVPGAAPNRESKYVMKLMALLHECGHVKDIENRVNFELQTRRVNLIEAEVYAQLYSLERMAEMNYFQCFNMLLEALKKYTKQDDYMGDVARLTLERLPNYELIDVNEIKLLPLRNDDLIALGPDGRRALGHPE